MRVGAFTKIHSLEDVSLSLENENVLFQPESRVGSSQEESFCKRGDRRIQYAFRLLFTKGLIKQGLRKQKGIHFHTLFGIYLHDLEVNRITTFMASP